MMKVGLNNFETRWTDMKNFERVQINGFSDAKRTPRTPLCRMYLRCQNVVKSVNFVLSRVMKTSDKILIRRKSDTFF